MNRRSREYLKTQSAFKAAMKNPDASEKKRSRLFRRMEKQMEKLGHGSDRYQLWRMN